MESGQISLKEYSTIGECLLIDVKDWNVWNQIISIIVLLL